MLEKVNFFTPFYDPYLSVKLYVVWKSHKTGESDLVDFNVNTSSMRPFSQHRPLTKPAVVESPATLKILKA